MNALLWFRRHAVEPEPRRATLRHIFTVGLALCIAAVCDAAVDERSLQITPPRVGFVEGEVSFWRPGAGDWEAAQVNIPLASGDALATRDGKVEVQIGPRSFLRAADNTQMRVKSVEPDFLQVELSDGRATIDLRELKSGTVVQIDTPNASVTTGRDGYYRIDVNGGATNVTVRRAGHASVTPHGDRPIDLATGESVQIEGAGDQQLTVGAAPGFDEWDRWSYDRADNLLAAPRSSSVSSDVYGAEDLEQNGTWRYESNYGRVWVPNAVPAGWAPYTNGRWLYDPFYGWSWADYAPWGWAPYHYGRWVYNGYWGWAPGPALVASVYSPALVAFFGPVSIGIGLPFVSWVPLGWGEPLIPWWGPVGFVGSPCWWGWGGPRVVNNIVINNYDNVNVNSINQYRNMRAPGGVTSVDKGHFTDPALQRARLNDVRINQLKPIPGRPPVETAALQTASAGSKPPLHDYAARQPGGTRADGAAGVSNMVRSAPGQGNVAAVPSKGAASPDAYRGHMSEQGNVAAVPSKGAASPDAYRGRVSGQGNVAAVPSKDAASPDASRSLDRARAAQPNALPKGATAPSRSYQMRGSDAPPPLPPKGAANVDPAKSMRAAAPSMRRADSPPPLPKTDSASGSYSRWGVRPPTTRRDGAVQRSREASTTTNPAYGAPARRSGSSRAGETAKPSGGTTVRTYTNPSQGAPAAPSVSRYGYARSYDRAPSVSSGGGGSMKSMPAPSGGGGGSYGGRSMGYGGGGGGHSMGYGGGGGGHSMGGGGGGGRSGGVNIAR